MKSKLTAIVFASLLLSNMSAYGATWIPFDFPNAQSTSVTDVDGSRIVGSYTDANARNRGFIYDGTNWTTLSYPGSSSTGASGYDDGKTVGTYSTNGYSYGFSYDGTNYTPLIYPGASNTIARDINNGKIVGNYNTPGGFELNGRGFIYDGQSWNTVQAPGSLDTVVTATEAGKMVGFWNEDLNSDPSILSPSKNKAFVFDGLNWTYLSFPGATETNAWGISGDIIVGNYSNTSSSLEYHGFIYDGTNWESLDFPGAAYTRIDGIDGDTIWGSYKYSVYGNNHGFIYVVPEPTTMLLLGLSGLMVCRKK